MVRNSVKARELARLKTYYPNRPNDPTAPSPSRPLPAQFAAKSAAYLLLP